MIGLSLSFCVKDILRGKVKEEDVEKIIAGTCIERPEHLEEVMRRYSECYWDKDIRSAGIVARLFAAHKIEQPRVEGKPLPNIGSGVWVNSMEEVVYVSEEEGW